MRKKNFFEALKGLAAPFLDEDEPAWAPIEKLEARALEHEEAEASLMALAEPEAEAEAEAEAETEAKVPKARTEADAEAKAEAVVAKAKAEAANARAEAAVSAHPKAQPVAEPRAKGSPHAEVLNLPSFLRDYQAQFSVHPRADAEPKAEADAEADAEPKAKAETEAETKAETRAEPETEAETEAEARAEPEAEAEAETETETEAAKKGRRSIATRLASLYINNPEELNRIVDEYLSSAEKSKTRLTFILENSPRFARWLRDKAPVDVISQFPIEIWELIDSSAK